ncbi:MAG: ABC transporter permease subunit [Dehalococcoidia bacterium]
MFEGDTIGGLRTALRAEVFKTVRRRMTWICLAMIVVLVGLVYLGLWLRLREGAGGRPDEALVWVAVRAGVSFRNAVPYGLAVERFFATIICVVFAGTVMGNEYDWRTVGVAVSRGVRRWHFLAAKLAVVTGFTVAVAVTGLLAAMAASVILTLSYDLRWGTVDLAWGWGLVAGLARTVFVILPFVFLAVLVGNVWRSAGQAVGASLGLFFSEQIFIGLLSLTDGWPRAITKGLFSENIDAVMRANGIFASGGGPFIIEGGGPPLWRATAFLAAWMALFLAATFVRFNRRDIQD